MDPERALQDLQQLINDMRMVLGRAMDKEISKQDAVSRLDHALGPALDIVQVKAAGSQAPAVGADEELVDGCRLALQQLRSGHIDPDTAFDVLHGLVCGSPYDETGPQVHEMTLEPLPAAGVPRKRGA